MSQHFDYLLKNLLSDNSEYLYNYNQYLLKRFFEYALSQESYSNKVRKGVTGLHRQTACHPKHERVIMTACITALNTRGLDIMFYKTYYHDYLEFKSKHMGWRGRIEWFDFHRTIYSHFIWNDQLETFFWTWSKMQDQLKNFKSRYPRISRWRRQWYIQEMSKLRIYICRCLLVSNKSHLVSAFVTKNIVGVNRTVEGLCASFGYTCAKDGIITRADFTKTKEWKWLIQENIPITEIDVCKCVDVCMQSCFDKSRLFQLLTEKGSDQCWKFFFGMTQKQLLFVTSRVMSCFLSTKFNEYTGPYTRKDVVLKVFRFHDSMTKSLQKIISKSLGDYKIDAVTGADILVEIFHEKNLSDYTYLRQMCSLFVGDTGNFEDRQYRLKVNELYWLYKLLPPKVHVNLRRSIVQHTPVSRLEEGCPICLQDYNQRTRHPHDESEEPTFLPCGHVFHRKCVAEDISRRTFGATYNCPICRSNIHVASLQLTAAA